MANIKNAEGFAAVIIDRPSATAVSGSGEAARVKIKALDMPSGGFAALNIDKLSGAMLVSSVGDRIDTISVGGIIRIITKTQLQAAGEKPVIILANKIDRYLNTEKLATLRDAGCSLIFVSAQEFASYNEKELILILGGPDAYDGVGEIIRAIISKEDASFIRTEGNSKMIKMSNLWTEKQKVFIFSGSDRYNTKKVFDAMVNEVVV